MIETIRKTLTVLTAYTFYKKIYIAQNQLFLNYNSTKNIYQELNKCLLAQREYLNSLKFCLFFDFHSKNKSKPYEFKIKRNPSGKDERKKFNSKINEIENVIMNDYSFTNRESSIPLPLKNMTNKSMNKSNNAINTRKGIQKNEKK